MPSRDRAAFDAPPPTGIPAPVEVEGAAVSASMWRPGMPAPPGYLVVAAGLPDEKLVSNEQWAHRNDSQNHGAFIDTVNQIGDNAVDFARNLPVVGGLIDEEKVDPNSLDTGLGYFGQADDALTKADLNFTRPEKSAQDLYDTARSRADTSYGAGTLGAVDLSGATRLQGQQDTDLSRLDAAAAGRGPSAAQSQYAAGLSQARTQALALANTSRGSGRGAARLQAVSNFGASAGANAAQAAALRAQEMQGAQSAYSNALAGARTQDQSLATQGAQLRLQRDTAQETANRGAYDSTQQAQRGMLDVAGGAVGQQTSVAQGRAGVAGQQVNLATQKANAKQAQYDAARTEEDRRAKRHAANRKEVADDGAALATRL